MKTSTLGLRLSLAGAVTLLLVMAIFIWGNPLMKSLTITIAIIFTFSIGLPFYMSNREDRDRWRH